MSGNGDSEGSCPEFLPGQAEYGEAESQVPGGGPVQVCSDPPGTPYPSSGPLPSPLTRPLLTNNHLGVGLGLQIRNKR